MGCKIQLQPQKRSVHGEGPPATGASGLGTVSKLSECMQ